MFMRKGNSLCHILFAEIFCLCPKTKCLTTDIHCICSIGNGSL